LTLARWKARAGKCSGTIMEEMAAEIKDVRCTMNVDFGVLNGEPEALGFLQEGSETLAGVESIVLFSDGLMLPQEDPCAEQDIVLFSELYKQRGLTGVRNYVRNLQSEDPGCRKFPRFKTHDDIGAVALSM